MQRGVLKDVNWEIEVDSHKSWVLVVSDENESYHKLTVNSAKNQKDLIVYFTTIYEFNICKFF